MNLLQSGPAPKIQSFGKEELNLILKFGAQDLFKVNASFGRFSVLNFYVKDILDKMLFDFMFDTW